MDTETTGEVEETTEGVVDTPDESSAEETPNPLDMSDEAFAALLAQGFPETSDEETEENNEPPSVVSDDGETVTSEEAAPVEETEAEALETTEEGEEVTAAEETEVVELSAEDQLKELFTPFKANGREMSIDNIEDARTLMQMGVTITRRWLL